MDMSMNFFLIIILLILVILLVFLDIYEKTWYKIMFGLIKKMFMWLFINIVNASNHKKCALLNNQKCEIHPTLINLHPNKYSQ